MSYGHPCKRITGRPFAGPASAYPTFKRPASTCFNGPNDVFAPDFVEVGRAVFVFFVCALAELIKPTLAPAAPAAAMPKNRRRLYFAFSDIFVSCLLTYRSDLNAAR